MCTKFRLVTSYLLLELVSWEFPFNDPTFKSDAQRKIAYNSEILSSITGVPVRTRGQNRSGLQFCCLLLLHSKLVNNVCVCICE